MELDAGDYLPLTKVIFLESSGTAYSSEAALSAAGCFSVAEHLEIILEHVYQFVRLECFFDLGRHFVNELVQLIGYRGALVLWHVCVGLGLLFLHLFHH